MAVNVSQKDKTLNEIIDWCEQSAAEGLRLASALLRHHDMDAYGVVRGQINAYEKTADHCRSMVGHTGNTTTESPSQSEDTKQARLTPPTRTVRTFPASNPTMPEKRTD